LEASETAPIGCRGCFGILSRYRFGREEALSALESQRMDGPSSRLGWTRAAPSSSTRKALYFFKGLLKIQIQSNWAVHPHAE
jgi:hypothetical protein